MTRFLMPQSRGLHALTNSLILALCLLAGAHAFAQSPAVAATQPMDFTRISGSEDVDVAVPKAILPLGKKDAPALQAILDFLKTTNGASWTGLQAIGTFTSPGDNGASSAATLTIQNGDAFRLDVNAPEGPLSIRLQGNLGQILESNGIEHRLPLATAKSCLFAFPRIMANSFPNALTSIVDQGPISVDGKTLQRITISDPVFANRAVTAEDQISTIDLYFDPATHLLVKSVASVQLDSRDRERYVQAITYGDYRQVDGIVLPFAYTQTLNGQRQWDLQLTSVQLGPQVDDTYFSF
jgi:hypothetical protein